MNSFLNAIPAFDEVWIGVTIALIVSLCALGYNIYHSEKKRRTNEEKISIFSLYLVVHVVVWLAVIAIGDYKNFDSAIFPFFQENADGEKSAGTEEDDKGKVVEESKNDRTEDDKTENENRIVPFFEFPLISKYMSSWSENENDRYDKEHTDALWFDLRKADAAYYEFSITEEFNRLSGVLLVHKYFRKDYCPVLLQIYLDGRLCYESGEITCDSSAIPIELSFSECKSVKIIALRKESQESDGGGIIMLCDLKLFK